MKINEGIQRLTWRFRECVKNKKPFTVNKNDAEALNALIDFYERTSKDNYRNNEVMFKMYIWHRIEMMKHYKEDILGVQSQKTIANTLSKPVQSFLDRFTEFINESELKILSSGINDTKTPYFMLDDKKKNEGILKMQQLLKEKPDLFEVGKWDIKDVEENLIAEFNQFIQVVNYPL